VADLLECSREKLRYLLYRLPPENRYRAFNVAKKGGGPRLIQAPIPEICDLQRRLHLVLLQYFRPKHSTHGFTIGRSILTNARTHLGANVLLNIDLENFFPSIHFGRVRGRFMAKPFECPKAGATILAQLCCHDGRLPQGAPTSPIISNLICAGLDVDLQRFAAERQCRYTRYADDITVSTTRRDFSPDVASREDAIHAKPIIGPRLDEIIQNHGFKVNRGKVRLQRRNQRQVVTGLKVNQFPNPSRRLFSQIRAMLHALEKFKLEGAEKIYREKFALAHRSPLRGPPSFLWALRGKIQFIGAIRGQGSPKFVASARKLRDLAPEIVQHWDIRNINERLADALWVLECEETCTQGTAFYLRDVGLVTCAHAVHPKTHAFRAEASS
jgi:RNA-directed DNA polymerase